MTELVGHEGFRDLFTGCANFALHLCEAWPFSPAAQAQRLMQLVTNKACIAGVQPLPAKVELQRVASRTWEIKWINREIGLSKPETIPAGSIGADAKV